MDDSLSEGSVGSVGAGIMLQRLFSMAVSRERISLVSGEVRRTWRSGETGGSGAAGEPSVTIAGALVQHEVMVDAC